MRIRKLPPPSPGQFGKDHTAIEVIRPDEWAAADPFILLMDDRVDGMLRAGPHPHAGFETVTFVVDGTIPAEHRGDTLAPGDVEWTTAGSGIVHGPDRPIAGKMRVLQLWLTLPQADRWTAPDHQLVRGADAPVHEAPGVTVRLYSGRAAGLESPTRNRVPVTLADLRVAAGASITHEVPASHAGFLYVIDGAATVNGERLEVQDIAWLEPGDRTLTIEGAARVLLYTGERQNIPIAWYGPFIGDTRADIARSIERYQAGTFLRV